jgi:inner membrane protein
MCSPIGHSLAGYLIYCIGAKSISPKKDKVFFAAAVVSANLPDFDVIPGLIVGQPNLYHHGISHSIGFALVAAVVIAWGVRRFTLFSFRKNFLFFFLACSSHLLLDYFAFDGRPPFGIPIFWPLSSRYFIFFHPIFPSFNHSRFVHATISQFMLGVFSLHNLYAIFLECSIMLPIFIIVFRILKKETPK